jgi:protein TonB
VFEQSILIENDANRKWSLLASLTAELAVVSVVILIPLAYGEQLHGSRWKSVTIGPPLRPIEPEPVQASSNNAGSRSTTSRRVFRAFHESRSLSSPAHQTENIEGEEPSWRPGAPSEAGVSIDKLIGQIRTPPPPPPPPSTKVPTGPVRVSSDLQTAKLVKKVIPEYPVLARTMRVSGVVHLVGIIAKDGTIRNLELISGNPLLARAAIDAVRQWVYKPTLLNGEAVEVIAPIDVNFTLSQ